MCWSRSNPRKTRVLSSWVEILPARQLLTLVKHIHSWKTVKHFEKLPTIHLWSQSFSFPIDSLFKFPGKLIWKKVSVLKGEWRACYFRHVWFRLFEDNTEHQDVLSCFLSTKITFSMKTTCDFRPTRIFKSVSPKCLQENKASGTDPRGITV